MSNKSGQRTTRKSCWHYRKGICKWGDQCYDSHEYCTNPEFDRSILGTCMRNAKTIRQQVEYYLSDENLKRDSFFHNLIAQAEDGFIPLSVITACPRMRRMGASETSVINALAESPLLELRITPQHAEVRRQSALPSQSPLPICQEPEPGVEELPLQLLRDIGPRLSAEWESVIHDIARRSFCSVLRWASTYDDPQEDFHTVFSSTPWIKLVNDSLCARSTAWFLMEAGCSCSYTYGATTVKGAPMPDALWKICSRYLGQHLGLPRESWPTAVNLNLYEDGSETLGWHADDEKLFDGILRDCCIISLSLGASRLFELALADPESECGHPRPCLQKVCRVELGSGDICVMEGRLQKYYLHQVPMAPGPANSVGPRINLTFRWIRNHRNGCPKFDDVGASNLLQHDR